MTDPETRARELLAAELGGKPALIDIVETVDTPLAIRAIVAALTPRAIPVDVADLCERLRRKSDWMPAWGTDFAPVNPEGEQAATALETLAAENARLLEAIAPFAMSDIDVSGTAAIGVTRDHILRAYDAFHGIQRRAALSSVTQVKEPRP